MNATSYFPRLSARALHVLVRSQCLMAISAGVFVWECAALLGRGLPWAWYPLAVVGCWWVYLADAGFGPAHEDRINMPARVAFLERHGPTLASLLLILTVVALALAHFGSGVQPRTVLLEGVLLAIAVAYVFPLLPRGGRTRRRLKEFELLKPVIISAAWLGGGMLLALMEGRLQAGPAAPPPVMFAFLFLLLLGDSLALDWRDRRGDGEQGIRTWAVRLGDATAWLIAAECAVAAALAWLGSPASLWHWTAGTMVLAHAASLLAFPLAPSHPLLFYVAVAAWRFVGLIPLLVLA